MFPGQLGPVPPLRGAPRRHHQGAHPAALRDHITSSQGPGHVYPVVDLGQQERPVLVGDRHGRILYRGVGRPNDRPVPHRQYVEQALVVVVEGQDPTGVGDPAYDQVNALGEHQAVPGGRARQAAHVRDVRPTGVHDHRRGGLQVAAARHVPQADPPAVRGM